ncbi:Cof-type HAD-IIB family hydrolase [Bacillus cereus group sp. MYBK163-2]|uniref:Cof-like hydrolase n=2 Tax=Bacillus cereus group TaxID=86661 RepID=A0A9W5KRU1_BACCE|nr:MULTISPECIES: Cof-type HAD-IIB family hydrolase [Bacillus cereus group]EEM45013.1 Cof-like hydrolase [Bacillus thuringiensis serovar pakistani str. T13001]EJR65537.1 cof-like hydrolase [Bacillus cereus VD154]KIU75337.1 haloacid dehalogenase-like family hydrolase [Bacillus thuringiensis Sbt003]MDA2253539.1 Cof-type HAD-IIB family hydrolase [Bacillus cereus]MDA2507227.1 Cof-type HAD-IIB family hydrolase [Bacillus cereus]
MTYKMIVLDLDDTLLRDDHTISTRTKEALMTAQEQGVKVVLASGRPTFGMRNVAKELRLEEYGSFILSFNGAKIINCKTNEEIFSSTLSPEIVHNLFEISQTEDVWIHTYMGDDIVTEENNPYTEIEGDITGMPIVVVDDFKDAVKEPVVKVLMNKEAERLVEVEKKLQKQLEGQLSVMRSKPFFLEFTEAGVTKGTSLNKLIQKLGIKREEVIAMGDSYNDQAMIEFAGLGVAMGNAPDDIKEIANYVTDTNMNDGVAKVVEKFVLKTDVLV